MKLVKKIIIVVVVVWLIFGWLLGVSFSNLNKVYALDSVEENVVKTDIDDADSFTVSKVDEKKIERECPTDKLVENVSREAEQIEQHKKTLPRILNLLKFGFQKNLKIILWN